MRSGIVYVIHLSSTRESVEEKESGTTEQATIGNREVEERRMPQDHQWNRGVSKMGLQSCD